MKGLLKALCGLALAFGLIRATYDGPAIIWAKTYDSGAKDVPSGVAVDDNFVYVTGYSSNGTNDDFQTICYDKDGNLIWNKVYDSGAEDIAKGVAIDDNFVYVTGYSSKEMIADFRTICYDKDGNLVWNKTYDSGASESARGVAVDSEFVYVTGWGWSSNGTDHDFRTICYDKDGNIIWNKTYDSGSHDYANGVAVDDEFVYVTGSSFLNSQTICYDKDGNLIWDKVYDSDDINMALGVAVDDNFVYVTGISWNETNRDFQTICYDKEGNLQWEKAYDLEDEEGANGVAVDDEFVYVTGGSCNGPNWDYLTICYDKEGNLIWNAVYDRSFYDKAFGVAVDEQGYLYVTGSSIGLADQDFRTIKYDRTVGIDELPASGFKLDLGDPAPNPFRLSTDICYSLAHSGPVSLKVYDVSGRPVKILSSGIKASGYYAITWDGRDDLGRAVAPGVYFIRIQAGNHTATRKLIRVR